MAIRDFYDIDYAVEHLDLHPFESSFIRMVRQKVAVPGNTPVNVSESRRKALEQQLETELKPVLKSDDFERFNLDNAFGHVARMAEQIIS